MTASRKLVILDLNGTLLLRSKRGSRSISLDGSSTLPRLRSVYGRPYLPTFREYLFHVETRKWLDVMVWSSAQPHSVADMVQYCFGETKRSLLAIWARDTLGLGMKEYHRKTQTTKDLAKAWSAFPTHSAKTTLLVDDSVLKAQLQPWNHLCILEYVSKLRARDLATLRQSTLTDTGLGRALQRMSLTTRRLDDSHPSDKPNDSNMHKYDEALLAVIGILNELKDVPDVSAWMRAGKLSTGAPSPQGTAEALSIPLSNPKDTELPSEVSSQSLVGTVVSTEGSDPEEPITRMWFENETTLDVWVDKGKRILKELDIEIVCGIGS